MPTIGRLPTARLRRRDGVKKTFPNKVKLFILSLFMIRFVYWRVSSNTDNASISLVMNKPSAIIDKNEQSITDTDKHLLTTKNDDTTQQRDPLNEQQKASAPKDPKATTNNTKPSKPLRPLNLEIISRTHPIDLEFEDVTKGEREPAHPHRGAKDEDGNYGYVFDESALRNNPSPFQIVGEGEEGDACVEKNDGNRKMLTEKVSVDFSAHDAAEAEAKDSKKPRAKIMCIVYTIEKNHYRIPSIKQTWGPRCDGFIVMSDKTDPVLGTVNVPHEGNEEYNNIWQKIRSVWSYIYDYHYDSYDWFHIGGDDLYLLVENLRLYLESEEIQLAANGGEVLPDPSKPPSSQYPLFLGRRFKERGNADKIFNSGGSGYTMNKAALKALVVDGFPTCMPHLKTFAEDVMVAKCLRENIDVYPYDTKDEDGGERYMPFQPQHHLTYKIPKGETDDWYANYSINIKEGFDHCAAKSVAFHYIKPNLMKRMHAILYGLCPS